MRGVCSGLEVIMTFSMVLLLILTFFTGACNKKTGLNLEITKEINQREYFNLEKKKIFDILRENRSAEEIRKKLIHACHEPTKEYQSVLRKVIASKKTLKTISNYIENNTNQHFIVHDIHHRDIANAACKMTIEEKYNVASTYFILWDLTDFEFERRDDFLLLNKIKGNHEFGLHISIIDEFMASKHCGAFSQGICLRDYFNNISSPELITLFNLINTKKFINDLRDFSKNQILRKKNDFEKYFGTVTSANTHGGAFSQGIKQALQRLSLDNSLKVPDLPSLIGEKHFKSIGFKIYLNQLIVEQSLYNSSTPTKKQSKTKYLSDSYGTLDEYLNGLVELLKFKGNTVMLTHPDVWQVRFRQDAYPQKVKTNVPRYSEQILFDELSLYDHQEYKYNYYPEFSPERVKKINAEYFFRKKKDKNLQASHGSKYGEIRLYDNSTGSLVYLPRGIKLAGTEALSLYLNEQSVKDSFVTIYKGDKTFSKMKTKDYTHEILPNNWKRIIIPLNQLEFSKINFDVLSGEWIKKSKNGYDKISNYSPWNGIKYIKSNNKDLLAIEIGGMGTRDSKIFFDRVSLLKNKGARILYGNIKGDLTKIKDVTVNTRNNTIKIPLNDNKIRWSVPLGVDKIELIIQKTNAERIYSSAGRFLEIADTIQTVEFNLDFEGAKEFPDKTINFRYIRDDERSTYYVPNWTYLNGVKDQKQEFFVEKQANSFGYLDKSREFQNTNNSYRVAFLGECYLAGHQVDSHDLVTNQIESLSNFYDIHDIEAIQIAHNTLVLTSTYPAIKNHAFKFKPDLILINFADPISVKYLNLELNAVERGYHPEYPESYKFTLDHDGNLVHHPHSPDWLLYRTDAQDILKSLKAKLNMKLDWRKELSKNKIEDPLVLKTLRTFKESLKLIALEAKAKGTKVGLVYSYVSGNKSSDTILKNRFQDLAEGAGISFIDVTNNLQQNGIFKNNEYAFKWKVAGHMSPLGHALVAESIYKYITENLLKTSANKNNNDLK